jgi:hypothetical protein
MPRLETNVAVTSSPSQAAATALLAWQVHLRKRSPQRLPGLLAALAFAALCVWFMFGSPLPAGVAVLLLIGACGEYLFPIAYQITPEGVAANSLTSRSTLAWKEARRCRLLPIGLLVSPLPQPSRLDATRGVLLRFAPNGEPGDRASVLAAVRQCAPELLTTANENE